VQGQPHRIFAIILNWNGGADTVACLESLRKQTHGPSRMVVVDNGSQDDSIARIGAWCAGAGSRVTTVMYESHEAEAGGRAADEQRLIQSGAGLQLVIVQARQNMGFAAGSNLGIRYALRAGADHILLLNNDTVVAPEALERMVRFLDDHVDYVGATGQIRYSGRSVIWNCGGDLTWFGSRRYLFSEQPVQSTPQSGWRRITFVTGCALLIRSSVFGKLGLLTERFFFGEEDYEFSLRLKRARYRIACCLDAVIEHKVGSSIDKAAPNTGLGRYYIYYLNRFIDMRDYYPRPVWWLWRLASLAFVLPRLRASRKLPWSGVALLARRLLIDSTVLDGVSKERFETAAGSGLESL
jgi:GT2 family glycosyltransferase